MAFYDKSFPYCVNRKRCDKESHVFADCLTVNDITQQKYKDLWNKFVEKQEQLQLL